MPWALEITRPAARDLRAIPRDDLHRIDSAFAAMQIDPYGGDVKFLRGFEGALRRRVGPWRILFRIDSTKAHRHCPRRQAKNLDDLLIRTTRRHMVVAMT